MLTNSIVPVYTWNLLRWGVISEIQSSPWLWNSTLVFGQKMKPVLSSVGRIDKHARGESARTFSRISLRDLRTSACSTKWNVVKGCQRLGCIVVWCCMLYASFKSVKEHVFQKCPALAIFDLALSQHKPHSQFAARLSHRRSSHGMDIATWTGRSSYNRIVHKVLI